MCKPDWWRQMRRERLWQMWWLQTQWLDCHRASWELLFRRVGRKTEDEDVGGEEGGNRNDMVTMAKCVELKVMAQVQ